MDKQDQSPLAPSCGHTAPGVFPPLIPLQAPSDFLSSAPDRLVDARTPSCLPPGQGCPRMGGVGPVSHRRPPAPPSSLQPIVPGVLRPERGGLGAPAALGKHKVLGQTSSRGPSPGHPLPGQGAPRRTAQRVKVLEAGWSAAGLVRGQEQAKALHFNESLLPGGLCLALSGAQ